MSRSFKILGLLAFFLLLAWAGANASTAVTAHQTTKKASFMDDTKDTDKADKTDSAAPTASSDDGSNGDYIPADESPDEGESEAD